MGARYGFGYVFGRRLMVGGRTRDVGRVGMRVRMALEELGPTFVELGRFLSARGDVLPPDITGELGRATAPVPPLPFAEVRALLEDELENTLERLFLEFRERPVRVGTFTQAHRAMLPGGRPALVVVGRPGVRRDLIAMRPVADVVRRRATIREGLPLDPVHAVGEFARHVTQRRDMFFAAQTVRRLRELESFPLKTPEVYRRYSTSRLATFEAPAEAAPLGDEGLREASGALVRLGILEGIFFADVAPERFVMGDGTLWLADPTETFALDEERLRGLAEVLAAVGRGDVDGVARTLPLLGCQAPRDTRVLGRELRDTLGSLGGPLWKEHPLVEIRARGLETARRGSVKLPVEVAQLFASLVAAERLGKLANGAAHEEMEPATEVAAEAARELISRFRSPRYVAERTARKLAQPDAYAEYPRQVHAILEELRDGEIEVLFRHRGLDELISRVDILANRLVFALLIAALILGSSLLGIFGESNFRLLGVGILGLAGFVLAAVLGLLLLVGIIRSGRL